MYNIERRIEIEMLKKNAKCYGCYHCHKNSCIGEDKAEQIRYACFATEKDIKMCNLMCGGIDNNENN